MGYLVRPEAETLRDDAFAVRTRGRIHEPPALVREERLHAGGRGTGDRTAAEAPPPREARDVLRPVMDQPLDLVGAQLDLPAAELEVGLYAQNGRRLEVPVLRVVDQRCVALRERRNRQRGDEREAQRDARGNRAATPDKPTPSHVGTVRTAR